MRWRKRGIRKVCIALGGFLLLLALMVWGPVSVGAYEGASRLTLVGPVQATPTVDLTMTALAKEQLDLQVKQLQNQLENQNNWFANTSTALIAAITAIVVAFIGFTQWAGTARQSKDKDLKAQAEERFKTAVAALGDQNEATQVGGAILLRSFLNDDDEKTYSRYYAQIFDLAVAYLRLLDISHPPEDPDGLPPLPKGPSAPLQLNTLRQALIVVFREAFPLARDTISSNKKEVFQPLDTVDESEIVSYTGKAIQSLDATGVQLGNAYLALADLKNVWMRNAFLRNADLRGADLAEALLSEANLSGVNLRKANLSGAILRKANLSGAVLSDTVLSGAILSEANLSGARLHRTKLIGARLREVDLSNADLRDADLTGAHLRKADLSNANLSGAKVTEEQLKKAKSLEGITLPDQPTPTS